MRKWSLSQLFRRESVAELMESSLRRKAFVKSFMSDLTYIDRI